MHTIVAQAWCGGGGAKMTNNDWQAVADSGDMQGMRPWLML